MPLLAIAEHRLRPGVADRYADTVARMLHSVDGEIGRYSSYVALDPSQNRALAVSLVESHRRLAEGLLKVGDDLAQRFADLVEPRDGRPWEAFRELMRSEKLGIRGRVLSAGRFTVPEAARERFEGLSARVFDALCGFAGVTSVVLAERMDAPSEKAFLVIYENQAAREEVAASGGTIPYAGIVAMPSFRQFAGELRYGWERTEEVVRPG
jgi:hypothetical protein